MKSQKLYESCLGFRVEITIETATEENNAYEYIPASVLCTVAEKVECGERKGTFANLQDDDANKEHLLSGSWRVIEIDYGIICRVLNWKYNFAQSERLTEELFIRYFGGVMGRHYYAKWNAEYQHDLYKMLSYFGTSPADGQLFCDMIAEQMNNFEKRTENGQK